MFYLFPAYVARNYYLLVAVVALATIQAAANASRLRGLLFGGRMVLPARSLGVLAAVAIVATGLFVRLSPDLLSPGLAGSELMLVFGAGVLTAGIVSLLGGMWCTTDSEAPVGLDSVPQYALPVAGYTYRVWPGAEAPRRLAIVLSDPDLPESSMLPLCEAVSAAGLSCYLVGWGRDGVPRYPDALAAIPMCIAVHGGEQPQVIVIGAGAAAALAVRAAADDERIVRVLAVAPALEPENLVTGLALLSAMNAVDAWRWQRAWDRRSFVEAIAAKELPVRVGRRLELLVSVDDGCFRAPSWLDAESAPTVGSRTLAGIAHRSLVEGAATWVSEVLAGNEEGAGVGSR